MNFKTTFFLLLLLLLAGGFLLWDRQNPQLIEDDLAATGQKNTWPLPSVKDIDATKVTSFSFTKGKQLFAMSKQAKQWKQTKPVSFSLNEWSAKKLIDDACALTYNEKLTPNQNGAPTLTALKLDPPLATVTINSNGQQVQLKLGRKSLGGRAYLMVNNDPQVYVVNDALHLHILDQEVNSWRQHTLAAPKANTALALTLNNAKQPTIVLNKKQSHWFLAQPQQGRADAKAVTNLFKVFSHIFINQFVTDTPRDLSLYGLTKPQLKLTITTLAATDPNTSTTQKTESVQASNQTHTFLIGDAVNLKNEQFFATWSQTSNANNQVVFTINKDILEKFQKSMTDLRDPRICLAKSNRINALTLTRNGQTQYHLQKTSGGWEFAAPKPTFKPDYQAVSNLIQSLTETKADDYQPNYKLNRNPLITVTLTTTGQSNPETIKVYQANNAQYAVIHNLETTGYLVSKKVLAPLFAPTLSLRNRSILETKPNQIKSLTLQTPKGRVLVFSRHKLAPKNETQKKNNQSDDDNPKANASLSAWQLADYPKFETQALDDLLEAVLPLNATGWAENASPKDQVYQLTLVTLNGKTIKLKLDTKSQLASCSQVDATFKFSKRLVEKLAAEFQYRTVLNFTNQQIKDLQITRHSQTIQLTRNTTNNQWAATNTNGRKIDKAIVEALVDTLAGLRVVQFIDTPAKKHPTLQVQIIGHATDNKIFKLELFEGNLGKINHQRFTLSSDTMAKLTATVLLKK